MREKDVVGVEAKERFGPLAQFKWGDVRLFIEYQAQQNHVGMPSARTIERTMLDSS